MKPDAKQARQGAVICPHCDARAGWDGFGREPWRRTNTATIPLATEGRAARSRARKRANRARNSGRAWV